MATLDSCKCELRSIINELYSIRSGISRDFCGIGHENCLTAIDGVIDQYEYLQYLLNNVDTNRIAEFVNQ